MKIQTKINFDTITMTEPMINDVYVIAENKETSKFYIFSHNGYDSFGILEFSDLDKAIQEVKKLIKNYFINRCENNPKGF